MNIAIIFAGGKGTRMKSDIPKQFLEINGKPIIIYTLELFQRHKKIDKIYISTIKTYIPYLKKIVEQYKINKVEGIVEGGETAQDSIYNALLKARKENSGNDIVLIHDGVRPFVSSDIIDENIASVLKYGSAITGINAYETIMISNNSKEINNVTVRKETFIGQAPQSFFLDEIIEAHEMIRKRKEKYEDMVDACTIMRTLGKKTYLVRGNKGNIKITTPEDVYVFKAFLDFKENEQTFGLGLTDKIINNI